MAHDSPVARAAAGRRLAPGAVPAVLRTALFYALSTGLPAIWPLAWVAPAPILAWALGEARALRVAAAAMLAFLLGQLGVAPAYVRVLPSAALGLVLLGPAVIFGGIVLLTRRAAGRLPPVAALFAFPALQVTYELVVATTSAHGTAGSLAYSQAGVPAVARIAALTGLSGITFAVSLVGSAAGLALREPRRAVAPLALAAAVVALGLGAGSLSASNDSGAPVRIGLVKADGDLAHFGTEDAAAALAVVDRYAGRVRALGARGAQVVVLPEKMVTLRGESLPAAFARLGEAARDARVLLVAGLDERPATGPRQNLAAVFSPEGRLVVRYQKQHLVPGWEDAYQRGGSLAWARDGVGVAICKDLDFGEPARRYAQAGARLLLVPAWDFVVDDELHQRMATLRGVEGGFTVARAAQQGLLTVTDARGRVVARAGRGEQADASLIAEVRAGGGGTPYSRLGDSFAWACGLGALVLLGAAEVRGRRRPGRQLAIEPAPLE